MEKTMLDYVVIIRKRLWLIAAFVLVSCITTFYVSENFVKPIYSASSQVLINNFTGAKDSNVLNEINTSLNLVESYKEIIISPVIMSKVMTDHPEFGLNEAQLVKKLKIQSSDKSQVIGLTVEGENYQTAAAIVNSITQTFVRSVPSLMNMNNVKVLNLADAVNRPEPINNSPIMNVAISFLVSLMIALGTVIFLDMINGTLRSEKEAEAVLGLRVIGSIPMIRKKDMGGTAGHSKERVGERTYAAIE